MTTPSKPAETMRPPSGLNATAETPAAWRKRRSPKIRATLSETLGGGRGVAALRQLGGAAEPIR
jgi:hypothetical protein